MHEGPPDQCKAVRVSNGGARRNELLEEEALMFGMQTRWAEALCLANRWCRVEHRPLPDVYMHWCMHWDVLDNCSWHAGWGMHGRIHHFLPRCLRPFPVCIGVPPLR